MQYQNDQAAALCSGGERRTLVRETFARLFGAPLFLATIVCLTLYQISGIIAFTEGDLLIRTLGVEAEGLGWVWVMAFVPGLVTAAGMWLVYYSAKTDGSEGKYRAGFTMIQVVMFNQMIITGIMLIVAAFKLWSIADRLAYTLWAVADGAFYDSVEAGIKTGIVLVVFGAIYCQFMMVVSVTLMKESVLELSPEYRISMSAAIINVITGCVMLIIQFRFSVDLTILLAGAYQVLLGVCMILYRERLRRLSV